MCAGYVQERGRVCQREGEGRGEEEVGEAEGGSAWQRWREGQRSAAGHRRLGGILGGVSPWQTRRPPDRAHLELDLVLELNLAVAVRTRVRRAWVGHAVEDAAQCSLGSLSRVASCWHRHEQRETVAAAVSIAAAASTNAATATATAPVGVWHWGHSRPRH